MKLSNESIFISAIRSFFNSFLGAIGVVFAIIFAFIIFAIMMPSDHKEGFKSKLEILPDLNGNTKMLSLNTPVILQLDVHGVIGKPQLNTSSFWYQLIDSQKGILKNKRVKAILLHVNSPGGTATDSDAIYGMLQGYKKKFNVPIYAYVDGICASGSFYVACAANKIYASPMSMIGSVGALMGPFVNVSKTLEKWGVSTITITEGKDKDIMNPLRPWKKDEDQTLKEIGEYNYQRFVEIVSSARKIDKDKIINEYGAHIFSSPKSKEIGYIDVANSTYEKALLDLLNAASIDPQKSYQVVTLSPKVSWTQLFLTETKCFIQSLIKEFTLSTNYINEN